MQIPENNMAVVWMRCLSIVVVCGFALTCLVGVTAAGLPNPDIYDIEEYSLRDPYNAEIGYDFLAKIINYGDSGDVFHSVTKGTYPNEIRFSRKVFWMNAGERVEVTTHLPRNPSTSYNIYNFYIFAAEPGDTDFGNTSILRLDAPASVTLNSPGNGEQLHPGHYYRIMWQYTGEPGSAVRLELLKGAASSTIIPSTTIGHGGNGYYYWSIPTDQAYGTDYAIRITSAEGQTDTSDGFFTIGTVPVISLPGQTGAPTDPDGDGIYEDLNANGRLDFADVVLYFNQMAWIAANEPVSAFDLNGNGRIDFADIVTLFNEI